MNRFIISGEVVHIRDWDRQEKVFYEFMINTEKYSIPVLASAEYGTDKNDKLHRIREGMFVIAEGVITSKQYNGKIYPSLFVNAIEVVKSNGSSKPAQAKKEEPEPDDIPF